jgi:hypothetical protein
MATVARRREGTADPVEFLRHHPCLLLLGFLVSCAVAFIGGVWWMLSTGWWRALGAIMCLLSAPCAYYFFVFILTSGFEL